MYPCCRGLGVPKELPSDPIGDNEPNRRGDQEGYEVFVVVVLAHSYERIMMLTHWSERFTVHPRIPNQSENQTLTAVLVPQMRYEIPRHDAKIATTNAVMIPM